jgi:spore coat polysaccharide biosynthesis protein SpsF (cytidylyltransferase family)
MKTIFGALALLIAGCHPSDEEITRNSRLERELNEAKSRIATLERQLTRAEEIRGKSDSLLQTLESENARLKQQAIDLAADTASDLESMKELGRKLGRAEAGLESLTGSTPQVGNYRAISFDPPVTSEPEPPPWRYPTEPEARKIIRAAAEAKWGKNYEMVEYHINNQMESYRKLNAYEKKRWSDPAIRYALNAGGQKWGTNFEMVLYFVNNQLEAKSRLDQSR